LFRGFRGLPRFPRFGFVVTEENTFMAASETFIARAEPWLRTNARELIRALLPLPVLAMAWWVVSMQLPPNTMVGLVTYAIVTLMLVAAISYTYPRKRKMLHNGLMIASVVSDGVMALWLLSVAGPLTISVYPFYIIMALKALRYRRRFLWCLFVPTMLGPSYLATVYLDRQSTVAVTSLAASPPLTYWGLLGGTAVFVLMALALGERRLRDTLRLNAKINQQEVEYQERVSELEGTTNDLRVRIRRQQSLEESLRAITNSLSLDDVLSQILDSMMQMLDTSRVTAAALSLVQGESFTHRTLALDTTLPNTWAEPLAKQALARQTPVVINDALQEREWREMYQMGAVAALSVPLIDIDGVMRGALTVISRQRHAFTATDTRHLTSFSIQASVAIHNAELHAQLAHQRGMLEAVLRDINDGLVVLNGAGSIVLANPVAYEALHHSDSSAGGLREHITHLMRDVRSNSEGLLSRELQVGPNEEEPERFYQAFASLVSLPEQDSSHVAIVLHDITRNKATERARVEFISMVSHELRNPLNTLNGFLKVVLQGKAGALNELQQEFLGLANDQGELLKGRITELLEFNRLDAGKLKLAPQWTSLTDVLLMTYARFQVHADQAGLNMTIDMPSHIPELLIDGERINQVLTNLIENAMKATPAGGSIAIGAELCDTEVKVFVRDTGVGIAPEDQEKIFGRFYRVERKRTSQHGVHLGLGLSISQQIVEGHHGRIWVESALGEGTTFFFTLPLVAREQMIGEGRA
jgi:two-component system, NtrC family, sensor histidine kinase KinB